MLLGSRREQTSAPASNFTREAHDRLELYAVIDFFLSESAHHADIVLPGSLHEEDEGTESAGVLRQVLNGPERIKRCPRCSSTRLSSRIRR